MIKYNKPLLIVNILIILLVIFYMVHLFSYFGLKDKIIKDTEQISEPLKEVEIIEEEMVEEIPLIEEEIIEEIIEEAPDIIDANISLLDFSYEKINDTRFEVKGIKYKIENNGMNITNLKLLIYVYGESDSSTIKKEIKDILLVENINYKESITHSSIISAYYDGDFPYEAIVKTDLIISTSEENKTISFDERKEIIELLV